MKMILNRKMVILLLLSAVIFFYNSLLAQDADNLILDSTDIDDDLEETTSDTTSSADENPTGFTELNSNPSVVDGDLVTKKILLVDDFEKFQSWRGKIAREFGYMKVKRVPLKSIPSDLQPAFADNDNERRQVLGVRVTFEQRGKHSFEIYPPHPIDIEGVTQQFSVWVRTKRSIRHKLFAVFKDIRGNVYKKRFLIAGAVKQVNVNGMELNDHLRTDENKKAVYSQWRKFTCDITQIDEYTELLYNNKVNDAYPLQKSSFFTLSSFKKEGLTFMGFEVQCDLEQTIGDYYLYLDQFEVTTLVDNEDDAYDGIANDW